MTGPATEQLHLADVSWPEIGEGSTVFVPVGSTEQHGPHLPLSTDTIVATALADELGRITGGLVAPPIAIGASGEHQGFPGTLSIGTTALTNVLVELVRSLSLWASEVVLVNGHGGNVEAIRDAVDKLTSEGHKVSWVPCAAPGDAHAGHAETSLLMYLAPWHVRTRRLEIGNTAPLSEIIAEIVANGVREVAPNGVLGDPRNASATEGKNYFRLMVQQARNALL